jgi:hypothetical protein
MRKNNNNLAISFAGLALALDILVFIIASIIIFKTTSILVTLGLGVLIYILAYDAYRATSFIIEYLTRK